MQRFFALLAACLVFSFCHDAWSLGVGDPAPELKVSSWVKGGPIDGLAADKTYVVEFWATWCGPCRATIPHLTELAHQHKDVTFIGMNVWERGENVAEKVGKFVSDMGDKMDYAVALDTADGHMAKAWMEAAGQDGIPAAFLVHQGKVAWIGHPMDQLDKTLEAVLAGTYDIEKAKKVGEAQKRIEAFVEKAAEGATDEELAEEGRAIEALDQELGGLGPNNSKFVAREAIQGARFAAAMIAYRQGLMSGADEAEIAKLEEAARAATPEGENFDAIRDDLKERIREAGEWEKIYAVFTEYMQAVGEPGDAEKASELAGRLEAMDIKDPQILNNISWSLLTEESIKLRDLPLATRLAKKAVDATDGKDGAILDTYARALFDTGNVAEAIEYQKKAVAELPDDAEVAATLKRYEAAAAPAVAE